MFWARRLYWQCRFHLNRLKNHALGRTGSLTHQYQSSYLHISIIGASSNCPFCTKPRLFNWARKNSNGWALSEKGERLIINHHMLAQRHGREGHFRLILQVIMVCDCEKRQTLHAGKRFKKLTAQSADRRSRPRERNNLPVQFFNFCARQARAHP